jgi:hypothetical protein
MLPWDDARIQDLERERSLLVTEGVRFAAYLVNFP